MSFLIALLAAASGLASATLSHGDASSFTAAQHGPVGYQGPLANPVVQGDGHIADTVEVAAARGAHLAAVAKERALTGFGGSNGAGYGSGGYGGGIGGAYGGAGAYSYGPGTADIYQGQYGYAGLTSAGNGAGGYGGSDGGAGSLGGGSRGAYSYGPGTADVYRGQSGYAGLQSVASGHGGAGDWAGNQKH